MPDVTLAEEVRQQIAADIVSGRLKPGQPLEENALAAQFKISRTPVRDALRELGGTGLVELRPHRGVRVAALDIGRIEELFEAQAEVEAVCARLAALRLTPTDRRHLALIQERSRGYVETGNDVCYAQSDEQLHELIYRGTRNVILMDTARSLRRRGGPFRLPVFYTTHSRMTSSCDEHAVVVDAILRSDPAAAHEAMQEHLTNVSVHVIQYVNDELATPRPGESIGHHLDRKDLTP